MNIKFRQVLNANGDPRHYLYCSDECAGNESDSQAQLQPIISSLGALIGPDHTGQSCRVCQRKLVGPKPPPATISRIPVTPAPVRREPHVVR